jgi:hypothetical protein
MPRLAPLIKDDLPVEQSHAKSLATTGSERIP